MKLAAQIKRLSMSGMTLEQVAAMVIKSVAYVKQISAAMASPTDSKNG